MNGAQAETPEELHIRAGEYVLGVLASAEMRAVQQQAIGDPRLARAIADWERRFAPMQVAVLEIAPPDALWARIEQATAPVPDEGQNGKPPSRVTLVPSTVERPPAEPAGPRPLAARRVWPWKVATVASLALAAGVAAIVLVPSLAQRLHVPMPGARDVSLVAVLTPPESRLDTRQDTMPQMATDTGTARLVEPPSDIPDPAQAAGRVAGFLAAAWPDGTVVLTAFAPVQVPGGKKLELWIKPRDATAPRSLGVLPAAGRQVTLPAMPLAGTALMVTLEPPGGSPTGAPTGPVVYAGTLQQIRL